MMSLFDPRVWLAFLLAVILSLGVGAYFGYSHEKRAQETSALKTDVSASEAARNKEQVATDSMANMGTTLTTALSAQKASSDREIAILKAKLAALPATPLSGAIVSLLYPTTSTNVPTDSPAGLGTGSAPAYSDSTSAEQLEIAARNYREVCEPNAEQLKAVQDAYNDVREKFNAKPEK
jgi:uncharacterized protein (UPF0333 family)